MATRIIIDGYNLLASIWPMTDFGRDDIQNIRIELLQKLARYQILKKHHLTVVFDAWQGGMPTTKHEKFLGMSIIYTKLGETADHFIKKMLERSADGLVVVTSDRQIAAWAKERDVAVVSAREFAEKIELVGMMEAKGVGEEESYQESLSTKKRGNPKRLPRSLRRYQALKKKL